MLEFPREGVRLAVEGSLPIADYEIERGELFRPSNLPSITKLFRGCKVFEVLVIRVDRNKVISSFEIIPLLFKIINDSKYFLIINFIVLFRFRKLT